MKTQLKADLILIIVTMLWGSTYLLTKIGLNELKPFNLIALRFIIAFFISAIIFFKNIINSNKKTIKYAFLLSLVLLFVFITMTYGLKYTSASNAGFLVSISVILIPIIYLIVFKQKLKFKSILSVVLATIGIALLTLNIPFKISYGDVLCILCAILYAFHIVLTEAFTKEVDSIALGVLQLGFVGGLSFVFSLGIENFTIPKDSKTLIVVLILSIFCTAFGYIAQTYAQRYTNSVHTGLILSLEPVFSAILAFFILKEVLFLRQYIGGVILIISVLLVETE